jgi:hypothetical protein
MTIFLHKLKIQLQEGTQDTINPYELMQRKLRFIEWNLGRSQGGAGGAQPPLTSVEKLCQNGYISLCQKHVFLTTSS